MIDLCVRLHVDVRGGSLRWLRAPACGVCYYCRTKNEDLGLGARARPSVDGAVASARAPFARSARRRMKCKECGEIKGEMPPYQNQRGLRVAASVVVVAQPSLDTADFDSVVDGRQCSSVFTRRVHAARGLLQNLHPISDASWSRPRRSKSSPRPRTRRCATGWRASTSC